MKRVLIALIISMLLPAVAGAAISSLAVSNQTSAAATISWTTEDQVSGQIHYSQNADLSDGLVAYDARGQAFTGCTHYVEIRQLKKQTTYYFAVVSGSEVDDDGGRYYTFRTMKEPFAPPGLCLLYGRVTQGNGSTPAEGAVVQLKLIHKITNGQIESHYLSKIIGNRGSFLFNIKEARSTSTDNTFSTISTGDTIEIMAAYCAGTSAARAITFQRCLTDVGSIVLAYGQSGGTTTVPDGTIPGDGTTTIPGTPPPAGGGGGGGGSGSGATTTIPVNPPGGDDDDDMTSTTTTIIPPVPDGTTTTTTAIDLAWPTTYDELWGPAKEQNLPLFRSFRDLRMLATPLGREYVLLIYSNSAELARMLSEDLSLRAHTRLVTAEFRTQVKSLVAGKPVTLSRPQVGRIDELLAHFEEAAESPALQKALSRIRKDFSAGTLFKEFGITVK